MSEIEELETRLSAALARIRQGIEARAVGGEPEAPGADPEALAEARAAQEAAETEVEELKAELSATRARLRGQVRDLESELAEKGEALRALDATVQQLKSANAALLAVTAQMRDAAVSGLEASAVEAVIDAAMSAELDGLRAARAAESAEVGAILATLAPVLDHAETEEA
ncbi:hypothetical protein [Poseidonocella sedimentorum]|uniref:Uncharacterized protein n=1 Tax=Poseidonocella sedimentorum TaxID=871652 RepID=A0A1I6CRE5_9RHOB|nr:hypothetical protein [Poseidonocella sedimentorum]SFQ95750.1 hypothetical protein SAMN04515673_101243 [Poseidonocella sedimentorum]